MSMCVVLHVRSEFIFFIYLYIYFCSFSFIFIINNKSFQRRTEINNISHYEINDVAYVLY